MQPLATLTYRAFAPVVIASLAACNGPGQAAATSSITSAAASIDQDDICVTADWHVVSSGCSLGRKIAFTPNSWGNEQLPIWFVANNCDLRYQVALTKAGVVCIFKPLAPKQAASAASAASQ